MGRSIFTNWWGVGTAILGVALLALGTAGVVFGSGDGGGVIWASATLISGGLILGGLANLQRRIRAGSWMIAVGAAVAALSIFLIPVAALIVIGGLWTEHMRLSGAADPSHPRPVRAQPADITARWYLWLVAAPVLFAIGLGALVVLGDGQTVTGEDDTSLIAGLAYFGWLLSWLGAAISAGVGILLGARRGLGRHRTRPA